jgi:hypothetical protein
VAIPLFEQIFSQQAGRGGSFPMFNNPLQTGRAGDNQFGSFGTGMPSSGVPAAPPIGRGDLPGFPQAFGGGTTAHGKDLFALGPMSPAFTTDFMNFLKGQVGGGATPFNLSTGLPSGRETRPGELSAPMTPVLEQLASYYTGGPTSIPGANSLRELAETGSPIDQTPAWQAMIDAQQRNIAQNEAQLREQFASLGTLRGSPFGTAMTDFRTQTAKDQNALLAQMFAGSQEAAQGRRLTAAGALTGGAESVGQLLQGLDQASIDRLLQEFVRTRPEYSPYLNMLYGAATTFPPYLDRGSGGGFLSGLAGSAGTGVGTAIGGAVGGPIGAGVGAIADIFKGIFT